MERLRQEYLISYDIEDNKVRTKLYKSLLGYGLRGVQKSVFWGYLSSAELQAVKRDLLSSLKETDKAFITRTNVSGHPHSFFMGHPESDFNDWHDNYVI